MNTQQLRQMGVELLMQDRIKRGDVAEYVRAVNEIANQVDADDQFNRALENSTKQIDYIFSLRDKLMEKTYGR